MSQPRLTLSLCACSPLAVPAGSAWAQDHPVRPIALAVPSEPSEAVDPMARRVSDQLEKRLGPTQRPIVAELQGFVKSEIAGLGVVVVNASVAKLHKRIQPEMRSGIWQC